MHSIKEAGRIILSHSATYLESVACLTDGEECPTEADLHHLVRRLNQISGSTRGNFYSGCRYHIQRLAEYTLMREWSGARVQIRELYREMLQAFTT